MNVYYAGFMFVKNNPAYMKCLETFETLHVLRSFYYRVEAEGTIQYVKQLRAKEEKEYGSK